MGWRRDALLIVFVDLLRSIFWALKNLPNAREVTGPPGTRAGFVSDNAPSRSTSRLLYGRNNLAHATHSRIKFKPCLMCLMCLMFPSRYPRGVITLSYGDLSWLCNL
jgi:hypothetical protein